MHCDIKPENIMLVDKTSYRLKIIDFGSVSNEGTLNFMYIQSRYYRSPEVFLGLPLSCAIDMWSFGCILIELYLGIPIFAAASGYEQLGQIFGLLGLPKQALIDKCKNRKKYFVRENDFYVFKTESQYEKDTKTKLPAPYQSKINKKILKISDIKKVYAESKLRKKD